MSTLRTINIIHPSGSTTNVVNDSSGNITVGGGITSSSALDMGSSFKRNRILNGNMLIDQRNAGASVTPPATSAAYTVDRWFLYATQSSKLSVQQNAGSITPPVGFSSYVGLTSLSAYSVTSTDQFAFQQRIEGFNTADLNWGTANAKSVVLSFWAYSSLTGTFGGALNNTGTPSYPFTYSIPVANTWTYITVSITGSTTGTWATTSSSSISVIFSLGAGSTFSGTAGAWAAGNYVTATGTTSVVGTNGATFYITGVQLEVGTKATPYEMQIYSDQLAQCQRYYEKSYNSGIAPGTNITAAVNGQAWFTPSNSNVTGIEYSGTIPYQVSKRTSPTGRYWDLAGNASKISNDTSNNNKSVSAGAVFGSVGEWGYAYDFSLTSSTNARAYWCWDASAEL